MATFNGEKYIKEQLDSILCQLSEDDEVIISDDGSKDKTIDIVNSYKDSRIKLFYNLNPLKGVVSNFNNAIEKSNGNIIFLSDQDDVWLPNKVFLTVDKLKKYNIVVSNCSIVDKNLNLIQKSYFEIQKSKQGFFKNIYKSSYLGCCLAFNRELLEYVYPIPYNLNLYHDWWIGFFADLFYKPYFIEEVCLLYRRHDLANSPTGGKSNLSIINKIYYRIQLLVLALIRIIKINLS
jgi:glycosyltransferase involved in cell wall biosynthesis